MFYDISTFRDYLLLTAGDRRPFVYCFLKRVVRVSLPMMENRAAGRTLRYLLAALLIYCTCVFFLANFEFHSVPSRLSILAFLAALILTDILLYFTFFYEVYLSFSEPAACRPAPLVRCALPAKSAPTSKSRAAQGTISATT